MDANTIISAIGSVGFPIVACCALFYLYDKTITKLTATLDKMDKTLDKMYERLDHMEERMFQSMSDKKDDEK